MSNNGADDHSRPDETIVRPQSPPPSAQPQQPAAPPSQPPPPPPPPASAPAILSEFSGGGRNTLIQIASPLLLLAVQLRGTVSQPDAERLRQQVVAQVKNFENEAQAAGVPTQTVTVARYALCAMIDESVLNTPWGDHSGWAAKTLLVIFHGESYGGEKFFLVLDRLCNDFSKHIDLIEVMYCCMALGFAGRYQIEAGGQARLADIQDDVYRRLKMQRGAAAEELAPHWQGVEDKRNRLVRYVPLWVIAAAGACLLLGAFLLFHSWLNERSSPVSAQLARLGLDSATPPGSAPAPAPQRPSLKKLLAAQEQAGALSVEVQANGRERVQINASTMFASGGTRVSARQVALLDEVAAALKQLPGRVIVTGHTDDVPIRSGRFKDNYELSKVRAESVVAILAGGMDNPGRLEAIGAGASQPIATPPDTAENRARNRRVEITYIPEG